MKHMSVKLFSILGTIGMAIVAVSVMVWPNTNYDVSIVYTGKLMGEIEPCGCAEESDVGGLKRAATVIDRLKKEDPQLILISAGGLINSNGWQDKIKGKYIFDAMALMPYDSVGVQWRDMAYGVDFMRSHDVAWTNSNSIVGDVPFSRLIQRGKRTVAHFSWLDPNRAETQNVASTTTALAAEAKRLAAELAASKIQGAINVVSTTVTVDDLRRFVGLDDVDVVMTSSADEEYGAPYKIGDTVVVSYGTRGMRIAKLDVAIDDRQRIGAYRNTVVKLAKDVPDSSRLADWYDGYTAEVKENHYSLAERRKALESGDSSFAGGQSCAACHVGAARTWSESKHAKAIRTLEMVNKQFDPDCLGCHTVGFNRTGGFIDLSVSSALSNVQCEACHGAGRQHVESGGAQKTANATLSPEAICLQCHVGDHSPGFVFGPYWSRIAHAKE
jgi:hypothetical protein